MRSWEEPGKNPSEYRYALSGRVCASQHEAGSVDDDVELAWSVWGPHQQRRRSGLVHDMGCERIGKQGPAFLIRNDDSEPVSIDLEV